MAEYIEREALLADLVKRYCEPCEAEGKDHNHVRCLACWVDDMMGEIGDAPFVADVVEVKHGRWDVVFNGEEAMDYCTHCFKALGVHKGYSPKHNYCPNCGAKMDGGAE